MPFPAVAAEARIGGVGIPFGYAPGDTYSLVVTNPDLLFKWHTHSIQTKAQVSWNLSLLAPQLGIGAAYGISDAGGGHYSQLEYYRNGALQPDLTEVEDAFGQLGYPLNSNHLLIICKLL